jgi:hypothetical protein
MIQGRILQRFTSILEEHRDMANTEGTCRVAEQAHKSFKITTRLFMHIQGLRLLTVLG